MLFEYEYTSTTTLPEQKILFPLAFIYSPLCSETGLNQLKIKTYSVVLIFPTSPSNGLRPYTTHLFTTC